MSQFSLIHWFLISILGIGTLLCIGLAIRQFISIKFPPGRHEQIRRSFIVAGWASVAFFFLVAISGIFVWADTGIFRGIVLVYPLLCLVPLIFVISAFGTYIQFFWYKKLHNYREEITGSQIDRIDPHNPNSSSK